jgi:chromosome segregation protein
MQLKSLQVQGYKSFATKTEFGFEPGITAIVGPNGSGKSNIADAVRWVLGEQSYRLLRGKRTEDMIFAGSAQRARVGMAQVHLTLDNTNGDLPIEFSEVTLSRRAYRSGENEYLLNGNRVRLRDITELLARSGLARRSYTVIGQGMVDAALALRPQERRELFEEAAGIAHHQARRAEALNRLEETKANLLRINDIINEITPRLHRLERESDRTEHHALLTQQLDGLLRTWYGYRWKQEQLNLLRAEDALKRRERSLAQRREVMEVLDARTQSLRSRQAELRTALSAWHRQAGQLRAQADAVQRDLAVSQERARQEARQRDGLLADVAVLRAERKAALERIASIEADLAEREASVGQQAERVRQAEAALKAHEAERDRLVGELAALQAHVVELASRTADQEGRLAGLDERRTAGAQEIEAHRAAVGELDGRLSALRRQLEAAHAEANELEGGIQRLAAAAQGLGEAIDTTQSRQKTLRQAVNVARQHEDRLQARYDGLRRMREEGEGFSAGVRAVLRAARGEGATRLGGVLGTVAELVHVPAELEVAVSTALGPHLQDVVVETWHTARAAIEFLKQSRGGRVTFLPLDTVRPATRLDLQAGAEDEGADLLGLACDLVETAEPQVVPVIELLLGRTAVVRSLDAAHRLFHRLRDSFRIVTLDGEILQSTGAVTGGTALERDGSEVLSREREWRGLPEALARAQHAREEAETVLEAQVSAEQDLRSQMATLDRRIRERRQALALVQNRHADLTRQLDRLQAEVDWRHDRIQEGEASQTALDAQRVRVMDQLEAARDQAVRAEDRMASLQAELHALRGEAVYASVSDARTAAAVAENAWETRRMALEELRRRLDELQAQTETKVGLIARLEMEATDLQSRMEALATQEADLRTKLAAVEVQIGPAEEELETLDHERHGLDADETVARAQLREAETRNSQTMLGLSRQQDRVARLREQIMDDFGLVDMERLNGVTDQLPLPLGELVQTLPTVEVLPEGLEDEIHRLKAQLKRMGPVNPNAPAEYAEVLDRHIFLSNQAADLEEATQSLREVITELETLMRLAFDDTFQAVAAEFSRYFTELFGGGSARLVLTDPDDLDQTGVEILARPPGKRQQSLALLSGGERALTAVALIFAILVVSSPPFAFLDEVDAMLDEANISRFREALQCLSERTQCVVITHNRGTIQVADTLYGVSMGEDSTSQVVSLRLEGDRVKAVNGEDVALKENG